MKYSWFKVYHDIVNDPVIKLLSFEDRWHFIAALAMKSNGTLDKRYPSDDIRARAIAMHLGLSPPAAAEAHRRLFEVGLIDARWNPVQWDKHQERADRTATERKQRQRERERNQAVGDVTRDARDSHGTDREGDKDTEGESEHDRRAARAERLEVAIRAVYPKREGGQRWRDARMALNARIREGDSARDILAGVTRYAAYIRAKGDEGSRFVLQAATFLGTNRQYREPWVIPPARAEARQTAAVEAGRAWLEQEAVRHAAG